MRNYVIYTLSTDEVMFYVGVSSNIKKRMAQHRISYGKKICVDIVDEYWGSADTALALEEFWIKKYCDMGVKLINVQHNGEKRKPRSYKISDEEYWAAMKRAETSGINLATMIEFIVKAYGSGAYSIVFKPLSSPDKKIYE